MNMTPEQSKVIQELRAQGGPIIEREMIAIWFSKGDWKSQRRDTSAGVHGPTPLIAAMRCYVASKLGDMVEVPEEH